MKPKSYVNTIEDENYILRQRVDELDSKVRELYKCIDDMNKKIYMSVSFCQTDGVFDFFTDTLRYHNAEEDAFSEIASKAIKTILVDRYSSCGVSWNIQKIEESMMVKLIPRWTIDYWYVGMRFLRVHFHIHKRKKYFVKVLISDSDMVKNFRYVESEDKERLSYYLNHTPYYYKEKLYSFIRLNNYKELFTPLKYK